jgi:hypothetical protein
VEFAKYLDEASDRRRGLADAQKGPGVPLAQGRNRIATRTTGTTDERRKLLEKQGHSESAGYNESVDQVRLSSGCIYFGLTFQNRSI